VPVARSDPRRATIIGVAGIVVGIVMIAAVLILNNTGGGSSTTHSSRSRFDVGPAEEMAASIAKDGPLLFQDPVSGSVPIFVQHAGADPKVGWTSFEAAPNGCPLTWHQDTHDFTDCHGAHRPADGAGLHTFPVTVDKSGEVFVDLNPDASTTTTTATSAPPP